MTLRAPIALSFSIGGKSTDYLLTLFFPFLFFYWGSLACARSLRWVGARASPEASPSGSAVGAARGGVVSFLVRFLLVRCRPCARVRSPIAT